MIGKNILITGYKGLVGSYFYKNLQPKNSVLGVDLVDGDDAIDFFRQNRERFDLVIHAAAFVGGRSAFEKYPYKLFNNFSLDAEMLSWALRNRPEKIVYFSSSAAYPDYLQTKTLWRTLSEDDINLRDLQSPDPSIYGLSKLVGEHLVEHARREGLNIWVFRPFSGYAEEQSLDYPFPSFIKRALSGKPEFEIWGDGTQMRDFIHMQDIVDAILAAIELEPMTVNLCTGIGTSFNALASFVCGALDSNWRNRWSFEHLKDKPVGVHTRIGDPTLLNTFYMPKINLTQGIERALNSGRFS